MKKYVKNSKLPSDEIGFLGDDVNDLDLMRKCGFSENYLMHSKSN